MLGAEQNAGDIVDDMQGSEGQESELNEDEYAYMREQVGEDGNGDFSNVDGLLSPNVGINQVPASEDSIQREQVPQVDGLLHHPPRDNEIGQAAAPNKVDSHRSSFEEANPKPKSLKRQHSRSIEEEEKKKHQRSPGKPLKKQTIVQDDLSKNKILSQLFGKDAGKAKKELTSDNLLPQAQSDEAHRISAENQVISEALTGLKNKSFLPKDYAEKINEKERQASSFEPLNKPK